MSTPLSEPVAGILGWLVVAIPLALVLTALAAISVMKLGIPGGIAYVGALVIWASLLLWRGLRR